MVYFQPWPLSSIVLLVAVCLSLVDAFTTHRLYPAQRSGPIASHIPVSAPAAMNPAADTFREIAYARYSCKNFTDQPISKEILQDILETTVRAPTSFNSQPYKCIIVQDQGLKEEIASKAMLGVHNKKLCRQASVLAVFLADLNSQKLVGPKLLPLMREEGERKGLSGVGLYSDSFLKKVPFYVGLFANGYRRIVRFPSFLVKRIGFGVVTYFAPVPEIGTPDTWATKNTIFPAMSYLLACTSYGIGTAPMEGFDGRRLRKILKIKPGGRYTVPLVVATGYAGDNLPESGAGSDQEEEGVSKKDPGSEIALRGANIPTMRYKLEDIVSYDDQFDGSR